ncbi:hypothetical protein GXP67_33025 [Rhodocytophaga rosea]|uniref:Uncharacterized protein n=1 Tax=Rhodocytophaga rosea TaxID=2704465 RepID=A0A6C0GSY4_9BACT|nr:hypothetical protein [Rhodocytophaga rosea]QHT71136.1 hypothetical protein GXP67_33025 [Rhodocytophaga rosea]
MQPRFLFPHYLKRIGWLITIPALLIGLLYILNGQEFSFLEFHIRSKSNADLFLGEYENFTNELLGVLLIIGLNLVAFSKEKIEDEWVTKTRLESLQWGVYINSFLVLLSLVFFYGTDFLTVMTFNLFTVLLFFIIRFNFILYIKPSFESKNKVNAF